MSMKENKLARIGNISEDSDVRDIIERYAIRGYRRFVFMILFFAVLIVLAGYCLGMGTYPMSITEVYSAIWEHLTHLSEGLYTVEMRVVWNQRLPRLLFAIMIGAGLAVAGAAMQSMLKNPLADPYTTGISSGASFGATLAITLGASVGAGTYAIVGNAFIFALIPAGVIIALATIKKTSPATMILAGIAVMYVFNAFTQLLMLTADEKTMSAAYEWTVGSLSRASWETIPLMFILTAVGVMVIWYLSRYLNAMNSGDALAQTLGINVNKLRITLLVTISIMVAGLVSFAGIIGFVGLVAPHISRFFIGSDNRYLIPCSMFAGSAMMILSEIIAQAIARYYTLLPVGLITAMIGGPLFLLLIIRQRKEVW